MTWVLVLIVTTIAPGYMTSVSISTVPGYADLEECAGAGLQLKATMGQSLAFSYQCIPGPKAEAG